MKDFPLIHLYKAIILTTTILLLNQPGQSQEIQEMKITGRFDKTPLPEFLNSLKQTYGIRFFYKEEWVKSTEITGTFKEVPLIQTLNQAFRGKDLNFKFFQGNSVVIYPGNADGRSEAGSDKSQVLVIGDPLNQGRYQRAKLHGRVFDGKTGEPLAGAVIYVPETKVGVATNSKGRYSIEMPTGEMHLKVSFLSFEDQVQKIELIQDGNADFDLFEETHKIGG